MRTSPDHRTAPPRRRRVVNTSITERNDPLWMTPDVYKHIETTIGAQPAETGGMLGIDRATGVISHFLFDENADTSAATYSPDTSFVNAALREWNAKGIRLAGFVHSHPDGMTRPSSGDLRYVNRALAAMPTIREFALPIAQPNRVGSQDFLTGFAVHCVAGETELRERPIRIGTESAPHAEHFVRVADDAYDLELLSRSRIVVVGAGGSASFCEDMARIGVGQFVLIDPDYIDASNVATQKVRPSQIGTRKVRGLADGLLETSAHVRVLGLFGGVEQCLEPMERLLFGSLPGIAAGPPDATLLCGFTDDFEAQALVNRIALHHGVSTLAAQVYERGAGLELSFASPGLTSACGRCVLGPRYRALLGGEVPEVGSVGTPYAATALLNAVKQEIAVALLLGADSERIDDTRRSLEHPARKRAVDLLHRIGDRNLIQIRRDPDIAMHLGLNRFDRALAGADPDCFVFGETIWLRQEPEGPEFGLPPCADCGGTGDLSSAIGTFDDLARLDESLDPRRADLISRHQRRHACATA